MFKINKETKEIMVTRGDIASIIIGAKDINGSDYIFKKGDVLRFKVFRKNDCSAVELAKDIIVPNENATVQIFLTSEDTKIGNIISKPVSYWYEIELNPNNNPQTIVCYDDKNEKLFTLYPEGSDKK